MSHAGSIGGVASVSLSLGGGDALSGGSIPLFGDTNNDGFMSGAEDSALQVTLDLAGADQIGELNGLGGALAGAGVDNINVDLSGESFGSLTSQTDLNALLDTATISQLTDSGMGVNLHIDQGQASDLVAGGLNFADVSGAVTLDVHSSGTHLSTSLKDLQKLGVDSVSLDHGATSLGIHSLRVGLGVDDTLNLGSNNTVPLFGNDLNNDGIISGKEDTVLDVTLEMGTTQLSSIADLQQTLRDAGVDHLSVNASDVTDGNQYLEALSWIENGLDLNLQVSGTTSYASATNNIGEIIDTIDGGLDLLSSTNISQGETWGSLIQTLVDAGLGQVDVQPDATVHIADDLSAALYESGMLHALPEANFTIDVADAVKLLNTSFKAMSELGVDHVNAAEQVYVGLGLRDAGLQDIQDLFSAFGLEAPEQTAVFGNKAGLIVDQSTAENIRANSIDDIDGLFTKLQKLGITEIDVIGDNNQVEIFHNTDQLVRQDPVVPVDIRVIGGDAGSIADLFDPTILDKHVK